MSAQTLIFVEVKQLYLSDVVASNNEKNRVTVDASKVSPLARLGGESMLRSLLPFHCNVQNNLTG
ncbi:hypothetical protein ACLKMH_03920 [Psychromonas sp. KJ10-10]|uniref:hypothetical protein n=1 Tax=Psychromonas sp. KJ10-10 TaxID=3391823 RepID=UPI0039B52F87